MNYKHLSGIIIIIMLVRCFVLKKLLSIFLFGVYILGIPLNCAAQTISSEYFSDDIAIETSIEYTSADLKEANLDLACKSAVLMEKETGEILYEMNPNEKRAPASITKIMSLLLIMEAIESKKLTLQTKVTASEHACSMGGSQIWLEPGETMTVDELLKAVVIASANDATVALGEAIAGSEEAFVNMMNAKAAELKMEDTHFENASGLDAEGQLTSAHDIAVMSCELIKHDLIKDYSTVWMDSLRNGESQLVNTNKLVRFYSGATGLKTGTTSSAGFCVSATAEKNGMELCAVVMGAENNDGRFGSARKLLDYGFANWKICEVEIAKKELNNIKVIKGVKENVSIEAIDKGYYLLESGASDNIEKKINLEETLNAPIMKGQKVGFAEIQSNGKKIGEIDIVATENIEKLSYIICIYRMFKALIAL